MAWKGSVERAAQVEGNLAVVTHGLVCRSLATRRLEVPAEVGPQPPAWRNTALTVIEPVPPWRVSLLNCTAHLGGELEDGAPV